MPDDPELFWVLEAIGRYEQPLLRFAATIVGRHHARDVVQDVFLALCKQRREDVEVRLAPWLFTVCKNGALSLRRQHARLTDVEEEDVIDTTESGPSALEKKESAQRAMAALADLSERDREIVALRFAGGLSYKEIAAVTKLTVSHVGVILHEAMKSLRERMRREEEGLLPQPRRAP